MTNFRRKLKHLAKAYQRLTPEAGRKYIRDELRLLGYSGDSSDVWYTLFVYTRAKGRTLARLGRAALKKGKVTGLHRVAIYSNNGWDTREIRFTK